MSWNPFAQMPTNQSQAGQQAAPQQAPQTGNTPVPNGQQGMQTPGTNDAFATSNTAPPQQQAAPVSPLDQFNDLFQTNANAEAQIDPLTAPFWDYDPTKVREHVNTLSFMPSGEAAAGLIAKAFPNADPQAVTQLLNMIGQEAYYKNTMLTAKMSEEAGRHSMNRMKDFMPNGVKKSLTEQQLHQINPAFSHPTVAAYAQSVSADFAQKNPSWTPEQVASKTSEFMQAMSQTFQKPPTNTSPTTYGNQGQTDFSNFLS